MLGTFTYQNATKLYFGAGALENLAGELSHYGPVVQLIYGGGSIKKNGIYEKVCGILRKNGKTIVEDPGVMPNPTVEKLREGVKIAREHKVDLLLAVGGGSCCDYAKAVSVSVFCDEDPWDKYYLRFEEPDCAIVPVGCILTMAGTGSEMNAGAVITNREQKLKIGHVFGPEVMPKFSVLDPVFTYSLPKRQMVAGVYDIFNHICEQFFCGTDDNVSDYLAEGLMRSVIRNSLVALDDPENYEARSNLMWAATWALNTLIAQGKNGGDWMVHMIGQAVGAYTDATHGMTLAAVSGAYYRFILPYGIEKFKRFATEVWKISPAGKTDEELALAGLAAMEDWMKKLGLCMDLRALGATPEMIEGIADATVLLDGGYRPLSREDVVRVLTESF